MIFCDPDLISSRNLFQLLTQVIDLDPSELARIYQDFRSSFARTSESPFVDDFVRKPLVLINPDLLPLGSLEYPGIDLPCWIALSKPAQTIILLGQDPLRDDRYFPTPSEDAPYVVIGTPYSVHSRSLRQWRNSRRYWALIRYLLDAGYNLYLTDVFKFWVKGHRVRSSAEQTYRTILQGELDVVAPSGAAVFVAAFGQRAATFLLGADFSAGRRMGSAKAEIFSVGRMNVIPVLHPSPQNAGILPGYLRANGIDPGKGVEGIGEAITRAVSRFKEGRP